MTNFPIEVIKANVCSGECTSVTYTSRLLSIHLMINQSIKCLFVQKYIFSKPLKNIYIFSSRRLRFNINQIMGEIIFNQLMLIL